MRIRIIKSILSIYGAMVPGMTITVPEHIALNWIKNGIAMQDKSLDGASETKEAEVAEIPTPKPTPTTRPPLRHPKRKNKK